jgi:Protein of unknown function (DUF1064)
MLKWNWKQDKMGWKLQDIEKLANTGKIRAYKVVGLKSENKPKMSKYRSQKTTFDGKVWDSKKEANRYSELRRYEQLGEISDLRWHMPYQLSVCKYEADFVYKDKNGVEWVEDVKSRHTRKLPVYRLKKKMMKSELGIEIKEI